MRLALACLLLIGCAHGKMGRIDQPLEKGSVNKTVEIVVEPISAKDAQFMGDKSADADKLAQNRAVIEREYNTLIADWLAKKGYKARAVSKASNKGLAIVGTVSKFDHGSAAARFFVGMGAGSSNLFADFQLVDKSKNQVLSKFEVIATSGGSSGVRSFSSYLHDHMVDGAEKVAEYIDKSAN